MNSAVGYFCEITPCFDAVVLLEALMSDLILHGPSHRTYRGAYRGAYNGTNHRSSDNDANHRTYHGAYNCGNHRSSYKGANHRT
jgi:hypothetical protein